MTTHLVMFSGGAGSWYAARRVVEAHGADNVRLVFADTLMEDEDLYRFLDQAARDVGAELVKLTEGRTPWEVFFDVRYLGNTRIDPCSRVLKRELIRNWIEENYKPDECVAHLGIDWSEEHRFERAKKHWEPYRVEAPLIHPPYVTKKQMLEEMQAAGIEPPRLYEMGFPHNNCGGFCIKAGQAHFRLLLEKMPERYAYHEQKEQEIRDYLGKDVAILRDRRGGKTRPLTLEEFRLRFEGGDEGDKDEWGGCACFTP